MSALDESIDDLKYFVAGFFDGTLERCFDLDQLLWEVRRAADKELSSRPHLSNHIEAPPKLLKKLDLADLEKRSRDMSQPGIGALLHHLSGGSENDPANFYGQKIVDAKILDNRLKLSLYPSGKIIEVWDNGQSCCENRYMTTDDSVQSLIGHELTRIDAKPGANIEEDYDCHETVFVEIGTEIGFITIVNHNEHNGYYGGFGLTITEVK